MDTFSRRSSRLNIDITLDGQVKGIVPSYTTFDTIEGAVFIRADKDTEFDHIRITFEGTSKATILRQSPVAHISNNVNICHSFLKLRQPIDQTAYPEPREFQAHELYRFPFTFVVPDRLLPQACSHSTNNQHLKTAHMQLPPSFGDAMLSDDGKTLINDMSPMMSEIAYRIKVTVIKRDKTPTSPTSGPRVNPLSVLNSVAKKLRVIPAAIEQPPLEIESNCNDDYRTRREKYVRKTLLGGKTGRLVVTAAQPKPLELPARGIMTDAAVSTHIKLHVRFDPESEEQQPPRLRSLLSKLRVVTYYSSQPWTSFPSRKLATTYNNANQGLYSDTVGLSSLCVVSAQWQKHDGTDSRRSSLESTSSDGSTIHPLESYSCSGKPFYTASIVVPISLPTSKTFVPTFHCCLVSRVYSVELSLTYQSPGTTLLASSISLIIPIQITSAPGDGIAPTEDIPPNDMLPETHIEDEYYRPRSIIRTSSEYGSSDHHSQENHNASNDNNRNNIPSPVSTMIHDAQSTSNLDHHINAPPEYSTLAPAGVRTTASVSQAWVIRALHNV